MSNKAPCSWQRQLADQLCSSSLVAGDGGACNGVRIHHQGCLNTRDIDEQQDSFGLPEHFAANKFPTEVHITPEESVNGPLEDFDLPAPCHLQLQLLPSQDLSRHELFPAASLNNQAKQRAHRQTD